MAGVHDMSLPFKKRKAFGVMPSDPALVKPVKEPADVYVRVRMSGTA